MRFGAQTVSLGWPGYIVGALGIAWSVNLFNFMDGIDGIAASEAVFIAWGAALLAIVDGAIGCSACHGLRLRRGMLRIPSVELAAGEDLSWGCRPAATWATSWSCWPWAPRARIRRRLPCG